MTHLLMLASVALMIFAALQETRFVVRYSRTTWKRTSIGRSLMGKGRALAAILWATLLLPFAPLWLAMPLQVVLLAWLGYELTKRNRLFTTAQREIADRAARR